jgi:hemolysin activation/secretion protein
LAPYLPADPELVVRALLQLSGNPLFPIEQVAMGGGDTVRGYREYIFTTDDGAIGSAELRVPVARLPVPKLVATNEDGILQIAMFYDRGKGWNVAQANPSITDIAGAGGGLRWLIGSGLSAELYLAHAFREVHSGSSLQDKGIYFRIVSRLF